MEETERVRVAGAGIDAAAQLRPGVPRERHARDPGAHWERPEQQRGVEPLARSGLLRATPVFGTAVPPRGLSGAVRRLAYGFPEHRARRWVLLLMGDKLDVLEHRLSRRWLVTAAAALGVGCAALARAAARRA